MQDKGKPSQAKPSQAKPSQAKPRQSKARQCAATEDSTTMEHCCSGTAKNKQASKPGILPVLLLFSFLVYLLFPKTFCLSWPPPCVACNKWVCTLHAQPPANSTCHCKLGLPPPTLPGPQGPQVQLGHTQQHALSVSFLSFAVAVQFRWLAVQPTCSPWGSCTTLPCLDAAPAASAPPAGTLDNMSDDAVAVVVLGAFERAWLGAKLTKGASGLCNPACNHHCLCHHYIMIMNV